MVTTYQEDLSKDNHLFVRNLTKTDFNLQVHDNHGKINIIVIPRTFVPVDLTSWSPFHLLEESSELRTAIRGRILEFVPTETAQAEISTPQGRIEYERIMNKLSLVSKDLRADPADLSSSLDVAVIGDMDEVNDQLRDALANRDLASADRLALIKALDKENPPTLTKKDFEWILSTVDEGQKDLIAYAKDRLQEMSGLFNQ